MVCKVFKNLFVIPNNIGSDIGVKGQLKPTTTSPFSEVVLLVSGIGWLQATWNSHFFLFLKQFLLISDTGKSQ